jgi:hypothetical protein
VAKNGLEKTKCFFEKWITIKKLRNISIILFIVSLPFILKAISLFTVVRDGNGIGLYFIGLEINDKLPYGQIPVYAWSFLAIGVLLILFSVILFFRYRKSKAS